MQNLLYIQKYSFVIFKRKPINLLTSMRIKRFSLSRRRWQIQLSSNSKHSSSWKVRSGRARHSRFRGSGIPHWSICHILFKLFFTSILHHARFYWIAYIAHCLIDNYKNSQIFNLSGWAHSRKLQLSFIQKM